MIRYVLLLASLLALSGCASVPAPETAASTPAGQVAAEPAAAPVPQADHPAGLPLPLGTQRYKLSWDGQLEGEANRSLSCDASGCIYRTLGSVPGLATLEELSQFRWQDGQVEFLRYERNVQLLFFPQQLLIERLSDGSVRSQRKGVERRYAGVPGMVDLMGLELQLRADLQAGREPRTRYDVTDVRGITPVSLTRLADASLVVAGRSLATRVYERRDGERVTTLWLAPGEAWLPVQIVHRDGGETYRMVWQGADDRRH